MRTMNCRNVRREIEEAGPGDLLKNSVAEHMRSCVECAKFSEEDVKLREMVSSLGMVEAPGDFEFRLRARLAGEKPGVARPFSLGSFSLGFRNAAFASVVLMFAFGLFLLNLRSTTDTELTAKVETPAAASIATAPPQPAADQQATSSAAVTQDTLETRSPIQSRRPAVMASVGNRVKTRDLSSVPARVIRPSDLTARNSDFPIEARSQALKVSLDDGSGSSRTISLPPVSFGSQRAVSQSNSPLIASARGSW